MNAPAKLGWAIIAVAVLILVYYISVWYVIPVVAVYVIALGYAHRLDRKQEKRDKELSARWRLKP